METVNSKDSALDADFVKAVFYHVPRPPRHTGGFYLHLDEQNEPNKDFFHYTSGRWLWNEETQLAERHKVFNVNELKRIAAESVGAQTCVSMTKIGEGGSNRAFLLAFDNGKRAIARLPMHDNAGPPSQSMSSEVATMDFARSVLDIPAPEVYAWDAHKNNSVGSEYIIMNEAQGTQLGERWPHMTIDEKIAIVHQIVQLERKMLSVSFLHFGSLYYKSDAPKGSAAAHVIGDVTPEVQAEVLEKFSVGEMVERSWWAGERAHMRSIDRGPWEHPNEIIECLIDRELQWLKTHAYKSPQGNNGPFEKSPIQGDVKIHCDLLWKLSKALPCLTIPEYSLAHLHHEDLYYGNIFVEGTNITSLIDWQSSWIGPLQLQARNPPFLDVPKIQRVKLPENFEGLPAEERRKVEEQVEKTILLKVYLEKTEQTNPKFYGALKAPQSKILTKALQFASETWEGGILPLRGTLLKMQNQWDELGTGVQKCPFELTRGELQNEQQDADAFNKMRKFWASVFGWIFKDGWTSNERYAEALELFADLRRTTLDHLNGSERAAFLRDTQWIDVAKER